MNSNSSQQYEKYLSSWLGGIEGEISFWDAFLASKGAICECKKSTWDEMTGFEPNFTLEEDLNKDETKFLDVGSGPFSRCGIKTDKTKLDFTAVDPLAGIYRTLKEKYKINTKIQPETAMVENLHLKFKENTFDIVHMSNSLDHSFDPMLGIWQMLWVCKIGGKIILRHAANEAERENYAGFHQWNLCLEGDKFIIWRGDTKLDVNELLKDYATILVEADVREKTGNQKWVYNKVVINKTKDVPLHLNENFPLLMEKMLENICNLNYQNYKYKINNPIQTHKVYKFLGFKIKIKNKNRG